MASKCRISEAACHAEILVDAEMCRSFAVNDKPASSVLSITVQRAYYQCQKALARSRLWDSWFNIERHNLSSAGQMAQHSQDLDGQACK